MAVNFSFFKIPEHRVFNYQPRYYDPRKERREALMKELKKEKAQLEGEAWEDEPYVPGKLIRGKFTEAAAQNRRQPFKPTTMRLITYISLAIFFIFLVFFGDMFVELMNSIYR
ncbi:MAG: hypothetical protein IKV28_03790 [Bacteroidales bacterium]|nr:hypothetical protein [Bacteroidales bacterium]